MFRRLIVPLDGSARAERALPLAAQLARSAGGTVVLLRVVETHAPHFSRFEPPQVYLAHVDDELVEAKRYVANVAASEVMEDAKVEVRVLEGDAAGAILDAADDEAADLIVLCRHGHTGPVRWPVGSVARKVIRHAPLPTFVVHEGGVLPGGTAAVNHAGHRRAVVALDGSPLAERAVLPAADILEALAHGETAELRLLSIVPGARSGDGAEKYLRELRDRLASGPLAGRGITLDYALEHANDIAATLLRVVEPRDQTGMAVPAPEFLAMATHGRTGLQRWLLGSVTERALQVGLAPLLVVRSAR